MPTNANAYNSRVTDEALEKRFRDTFRSQGGAELVDDLYAQGVIVPIVDFTAAATGQQLAENLQTAWDFTTGLVQIKTTALTNIITNSGFWKIDLQYSGLVAQAGAATLNADLAIFDGASNKAVWQFSNSNNTADEFHSSVEESFVVFLRAGDSLRGRTQGTSYTLNVWYRQIATVNGDLVNPSGFTSS